MRIETVKNLFNLVPLEFKEALNRRDFKYCYDYMNSDDIYDNMNHLVIGQFTKLLLKHDINPLDYMEEIPDYFLDGSDIESFVIPNNIKRIEDFAFSSCKNLESIQIPSSVKEIGQNVFWDCISLESIEIPNSLTSIGYGIACGCISLKSITIPSSITVLDYEAFRHCSSLKSIKIPNSVTSIEACVFEGCTGLTSIEIPSSVKEIGYDAFLDCKCTITYDGTKKQWKSICHEAATEDFKGKIEFLK